VKISQKAIMFGLDTRITLLIFGVLSIIIGASLYKTFQEAKIVAIITEMNNIDKAFTEYLLDTGTYPEESDDLTYKLKIEELLTSNLKGWTGLYIQFIDRGTETDGILEHPVYKNVSAYRKTSGSWASPFLSTEQCLSTSDNCFIYICYSGLSRDEIELLELKIDGENFPTLGSFRYNTADTGCRQSILYDKRLAPAS